MTREVQVGSTSDRWLAMVYRPKIPSDALWLDLGSDEANAEGERILTAMELDHVLTDKPYEAGLVATVVGRRELWGFDAELNMAGRTVVWRDGEEPLDWDATEGKFLVFMPDPLLRKRHFIDAAYPIQSFYQIGGVDPMDWVGAGGCMVTGCGNVAWWLDMAGLVYCKGHQPSLLAPYKSTRRRK